MGTVERLQGRNSSGSSHAASGHQLDAFPIYRWESDLRSNHDRGHIRRVGGASSGGP